MRNLENFPKIFEGSGGPKGSRKNRVCVVGGGGGPRGPTQKISKRRKWSQMAPNMPNRGLSRKFGGKRPPTTSFGNISEKVGYGRILAGEKKIRRKISEKVTKPLRNWANSPRQIEKSRNFLKEIMFSHAKFQNFLKTAETT